MHVFFSVDIIVCDITLGSWLLHDRGNKAYYHRDSPRIVVPATPKVTSYPSKRKFHGIARITAQRKGSLVITFPT